MHQTLSIRTLPTLRLLLLAAALGLLATAASATPLRVSLGGLDSPGPASEQNAPPERARFVAVGAQSPPSPDDEEHTLVASHALPVPVPAPEAASDFNPSTVPAASESGLAVIEAAMAAERTLGRFALQADGESPADAEAIDRVAVVADAPASASAGGPAAPPPLDHLEQLREQRAALQWVIVPLVLVAMAVAWFSSRRTPRRRKGERTGERKSERTGERKGERTGERSRRSGRMHRA